ncbi:MAG: tetratricopeptide repeat protein [Ekhidna sp.]
MVKNVKQHLRLLFLVFSFFGAHFIQSQDYLIHADSRPAAYAYFQAQQYQDVIQLLEQESPTSADQEILALISKLKTGNGTNAGINDWVSENPNHPLLSLARYHSGAYYFYVPDSSASKNQLAKVNAEELSPSDKANYGFIYGVLNLGIGTYAAAKDLFEFAKANGFENQTQLIYYESFANYHLNETEDALKGFSTIQDHETYGSSSKYFIAKILLDANENDRVISLVQSELSDERSITSSALHQLIGEAYANKNQVAKADAYFEQAIKKHPGRPSPALFYQAGVSKFKMGNEEKALQYLTEAGIGAGPFAKLSAFQLGRVYLKKKNYPKSLAAYIEASSSEDSVIKEESLYYAAQLNFLLEQYTEAINYTDDYLEHFPNGRWKSDVQDVIAQSYLNTSNYDLAINHLEETGVRTPLQKDIYQKVTYQKATLEYNDGNLGEAQAWYLKSRLYGSDKSLLNSAYYHSGEIHLLQESYDEAIASYSKVSPLSPEASYGIGYACFNQNQYQKAITYFNTALKSADETIAVDAKLRLADCLYATKDYQRALRNYQSLRETEYVLYQKGLTLMGLGRQSEAIDLFRKIPSKSVFKSQAMFQTAQIAFEQAEFDAAENRFTSFINRYPDSNLAPKAYLNRAVSRSNLQKLDAARQDFETVIKQFVEREEAFNAILGLQQLKQKGVTVEDLDQQIAAYKAANPEDSSLEVVEFEAAKSSYFDLSYILAAEKLQAFLKEYPQTKFKAEAEYYLGDAYYRSGSLKEANEVFEKQKYVKNVFTGRILHRLGDINLELKEYEAAREAYQLLKEINLSQRDTYNAAKGLMQTAFESGDYASSITLADEVIDLVWKPLNAEKEARFVKAKAYLEMNESDAALRELEVLAKDEDAIAAESNYRVAEMLYAKGDHKASLDRLFDLNARFGSYREWINLSYLLIADNYIAMDELFQAKATLRSIIEHSDDDQVRALAQDKLLNIEQFNVNDSTSNE